MKATGPYIHILVGNNVKQFTANVSKVTIKRFSYLLLFFTINPTEKSRVTSLIASPKFFERLHDKMVHSKSRKNNTLS